MSTIMDLKLATPGMTSLHKAGLAGLYMTLKALDEKGITIDDLSWELSPTQVQLHWQSDKPLDAFNRLIEKSFWIDDEGFIRLTGLESDKAPGIEQKHLLYTALLNSFLQFGPHRPTEGKRNLQYEIDDKICSIKDFGPIKSFRHQSAADIYFNSKEQFNSDIDAAGWLYPGGGQRHVAHANTKLGEPLALGFVLLFAPIGTIYFTINSRTKGRKARLALLVPEIKDLELYAEMRSVIAAKGVLELTASSAADASLKLLTLISVTNLANQIAKIAGSFVCRIFTFGIVGWNEKQKSRTYTCTVISRKLTGLDNYFLANAIFPNRWQKSKDDTEKKATPSPTRYFVTTYTAREFIADNIAQGRCWYHNITSLITQKEHRKWLDYERKELNEMVEKATYDDERERLFIQVCHESWNRRLGKLGKRSSPDIGVLFRKDAEKLRVSIAHCKNAESLRETIVDFWSRAGLIPVLQGDGLIKLLPLFNEDNWRKSRDLALLALISYQPKDKTIAKALTESTNDENENENENEKIGE